MFSKKWLYLSALCVIIISHQAHADDGMWEKFDNPYRIGTIEDISIGYEAGSGSQRFIFAASASIPAGSG